MTRVIDSRGTDMQNVDLDFHTVPVNENLTLFIQDPENPQQYWLRKISTKACGIDIQGEVRACAYVIEQRGFFYNDTKYDTPVKAESLADAIRDVHQKEQEIDPVHRSTVFTVKYNGKDIHTIEEGLDKKLNRIAVGTGLVYEKHRTFFPN